MSSGMNLYLWDSLPGLLQSFLSFAFVASLFLVATNVAARKKQMQELPKPMDTSVFNKGFNYLLYHCIDRDVFSFCFH